MASLGLGTLLGGIGTVAGLFQKKPKNPYEGQLNNALTGQRNMANNVYGGLAQQAGSQYQGANTNAGQSYNQLRSTLQANPYTDTMTSGLLQRANAGNQDALRQAQAALTQNLAARGLSGSGMEAGGQSALLGQYLGQRNQNANDLALSAAGQLQQNQQSLYGLDTDRANTYYGQQQQALGNQQQINGNILAYLAQLSGAANAQGNAWQQNQAAGIGSLGSLLPGLFGGGGGNSGGYTGMAGAGTRINNRRTGSTQLY